MQGTASKGRLRIAVAAGIAIAGAVAVLGISAAQAGAAVKCGDTLDEPDRAYTLRKDLVDCPDTAITIDEDHITLDLNGHSITSPDGDGVHLVTGREGITIEKGTIKSPVDDGILIEGGTHVRVKNLTISKSEGPSIEVNDSTDAAVKKVEFQKPGDEALLISNLQGGNISHVNIEDAKRNAADFFDVDDLELNDIRAVAAANNDNGSGFSFQNGETVDVTGLTVKGFDSDGVYSAGVTPATLDNVSSKRNLGYGFFLVNSGGMTVKNSTGSGNELDGLFVDSTAGGIDVLRSTFNNNKSSGLVFEDGATGQVGDDSAADNAAYGISVPASGVTDLGANAASGNGLGDCVNITCIN